jgi:ketosteroid isomerase-like protein
MNADEIDRLEEARRSAMLAADLPVLARLFADDLVWVHASSRLDTKQSLIEKFTTGSLRCYRLDHSDVATRSYGSVAIVQGRLEMDVAVDGVKFTSVNRYTGVWASPSGAARLVVWQSTRVQD